MNFIDEELMVAVGKGDIAAFEQIVVRYQQFAWRVAYRYTGNRTDAEEISQEVFLRILDSAQNYRPFAKFSTYLYKAVANLCLDHIRKKRPQLTGEFPADKEFAETPDSKLQIQERDQAVKQVVNSLPARQRMVVILRYYENLPYSQIAASMNISIKAAERLLAHAREKLEVALTDFFEK